MSYDILLCTKRFKNKDESWGQPDGLCRKEKWPCRHMRAEAHSRAVLNRDLLTTVETVTLNVNNNQQRQMPYSFVQVWTCQLKTALSRWDISGNCARLVARRHEGRVPRNSKFSTVRSPTANIHIDSLVITSGNFVNCGTQQRTVK